MALTKILNDENKSYKPVLTDKLVYDTKPTVNSFNGITSDAVARAIAGASGEVPTVTESDNGKVLTAVYDEGGAAVEWADAQGGVPASTSADEDKVLTVNSSGVPVWAEAQGGGSLSDYVFRAVYGSTTYAEVRAAFTAGKSICLVDGDEDDGVIASDVTFADEDNQIIFSRGNAMNSSNNVRTDYVLARNGTWSTSSVAPRQVPSSTASDATKVLTVNSSGVPVWAAAQGGGGGSSYTFSAPLSESAGTVVLDVDTDELNIGPKQVTLSAQREISAAESGYAWFLGNLAGDTSDTVYTFTVSGVPVPNSVQVAYFSQGKHIYPMLVGETYGSWGNQWIIPTALSVNGGTGKLTGSFSVCFKSGESDYPTHLDSYGQLSWASVLVFVVADNVPSAQVSSSNIYGSTTSGSPVSYSTGGSMLLVKHPVPAVNLDDNGKVLKATYSEGVGSFGWDTAPSELPAVNLADNGKVLKATYSNGVGSFGWDTAPSELPAVTGNAGKVLSVNSGATGVQWTNFTQIEVVASMPANPTSGVLYIVTGA